uniref:MACPF domain-containing protein n=1 Tax=Macrostomum lignano TaxID=282301 RepID=A0A1I8FGL0_9PLAT
PPIRTKIDDFNKQSDEFGDLVVTNFKDHYHNPTYKNLHGIRWALEHCSGVPSASATADMANSELFGKWSSYRDENLEAVFTAMDPCPTPRRVLDRQEAGLQAQCLVSIEDASSGGSEEVQLSVKSLVINTETRLPIDSIARWNGGTSTELNCLACWEDGKLVIHMGEAASAEELKRSGRQQVRELLDSGELLLSCPRRRRSARESRDRAAAAGRPSRRGFHVATVGVQVAGNQEVLATSGTQHVVQGVELFNRGVWLGVQTNHLVEDEHRPAGLNASRTSYDVRAGIGRRNLPLSRFRILARLFITNASRAFFRPNIWMLNDPKRIGCRLLLECLEAVAVPGMQSRLTAADSAKIARIRLSPEYPARSRSQLGQLASPLPGGVVCPTCLLVAPQASSRLVQGSVARQELQQAIRSRGLPQEVANRLAALAFARSVSFHTFSFTVSALVGRGHYETFVGAGRRLDDVSVEFG